MNPKRLQKKKENNDYKKKTTQSDGTGCLSEHSSPTILEGESYFSESFHVVPESVEFMLSAVGESSLNWEVSGRERCFRLGARDSSEARAL